ncbi:MAG: nucleotide sugar dehydrogenase [Candidatus Velamenicoccus archaeovorus]
MRTPSWRSELRERLRAREARVGVVGLGYVGLPLLVSIVRAGFAGVGLDLDAERVDAVASGRSYVSDVPDDVLRELAGSLRVVGRPSALRTCDVVVICVPTPLKDHDPDLGFITAAGEQVGRHLARGALVVLESTTYPGTTDEVLRPLLEASGMAAGTDFALAYAPERIDPGRGLEHVRTTPRIVGGYTPACGRLAVAFYRTFVDRVHRVSSTREAEMAKLIENTYRHVNIALVNELAFLSRDLDVDIWEAIRAAATKPFGFQPFWPGPGVGGHCIAIDPSYLSWRVGQRTGHRLNFVEHAQEVNARMPGFVVQRIATALNEVGKPLRGSRILGIGLTYKPDVSDCRESPSITVLERLVAEGARVSYHDPYVPSVELAGRLHRSRPLTPRSLQAQDCVVVLTDHSTIDYEQVVRGSRLVFDTRGVTRGDRRNVVRL